MTSPAREPGRSDDSASDRPESAGSDQTGSDNADDTPEDDVRRKFREALERKQGKGGEPHQDGAARDGKVHDTGAPTPQRRTFRRKSG